MQSEKFIPDIKSRFPCLSPLRGGQAPACRPGRDALRGVRWTLARGAAGDPPAHIRPAGRPGKAPMRVRPSRNETLARRHVPLPGLRLGGASAGRARRSLPGWLAGWMLRGGGRLRQQPEPGEVGGAIGEARILQGPPRRQRSALDQRWPGSRSSRRVPRKGAR